MGQARRKRLRQELATRATALNKGELMDMATAEQKLASIASILSGVTPGPGIVPPDVAPPSSAPWLYTAGGLYQGDGPFDPAYDNVPKCLLMARECVNPNGTRAWKGGDADKALALARYITDPNRTFDEVENRLKGAGKNPVVGAFALLVGWAQHFPADTQGPELFTIAGLVADLVKKPTGTSTPSGKPV
jgi:hypothetical protein